MHKIFISYFFVTLFMAFTSAPTLISAFDASVDTSYFYNINEEENSNETVKIFEVKVVSNTQLTFTIFESEQKHSFASYSKLYKSFTLEFLSQPPELLS